MRSISVFLVGWLILIGCSTPTQRVAANAMTVGLRQQRSIVNDLVNIAKQGAVDKAIADAVKSVRDGNENAAQLSIETLANQFQKISWLEVQHERAVAVLRLAQQYIWQQQGVLDIYSREFQAAKEAVDNAKSDNK